MHTIINTRLPEFKVHAYHQGEFKTITDKDLTGKWAIIFFYPADFTFVCPTELLDLEEKYQELQRLGVEVYSVSTDTHFTHKAWHDNSESIKKITYPMLADPTGHLSRGFGVYMENEGLAQRGTFLIDPDGKIKLAEINDDGIGRNAEELLRKVQAAHFIRSNPNQVCPAKWKPGAQTLKPGLDLVGKI
jgi:peroxiredoxin (alkyl hydroperoxide reductase subunit C)